MELVCGLHNLKPEHYGCALTIGNFDGVHLGHQAILQTLRAKARLLNLPATVVTFEPYPLEFFLREKAQPRLMRLREKIPLLEKAGVERVICIRFNETFSQVSAENFVEHVLLKQMGAYYIIVGDDFRFGHKRQGDTHLLQQYSDQGHFEFEVMPPYLLDNQRISSTLIRQELQAGRLDQAERYLGHKYFMSGRIAHGDKLGRKLGFPTANIHLHRQVVPLTGVFAVLVYGLDDQPYQGVANLGNRPAVNGKRAILEIYIFGFDANIYGRHVTIEFIRRLRDEENYESLEALKQQIQQDAIAAKHFFQSYFREKG